MSVRRQRFRSSEFTNCGVALMTSYVVTLLVMCLREDPRYVCPLLMGVIALGLIVRYQVLAGQKQGRLEDLRLSLVRREGSQPAILAKEGESEVDSIVSQQERFFTRRAEDSSEIDAYWILSWVSLAGSVLALLYFEIFYSRG